MVDWRGLCDKSPILYQSIAGEIITIGEKLLDISAMKILVISSCTGEKKNHLCPAIEMYTGKQHTFTVEGIELLWSKYGKENVGFYILSAGYGLIPHDKIISPYDCTFQRMGINEIKDRSLRLGISETFKEIVLEYDLVYFLLGKQYLIALGDIVIRKPKRAIFFAAKCSMKSINLITRYIPENVETIMATKNEAKEYGCVVTSLKGKMFREYVKKTEPQDLNQ